MDPRHPEQSLARVKELIEQYERIEKDISTSVTSSRLGELEREGGLVIQEICLVAPRLHEAMMQASRQRRYDLSRGIVEKPVEKSLHRSDVVTEVEDPYKIEESKPKKKTTKKKTTKKAKK